MDGEHRHSRLERIGPTARAGVAGVREQVAGLLGCMPQELVFTSGGSESDNHALMGIADGESCFDVSVSWPYRPARLATAAAPSHQRR